VIWAAPYRCAEFRPAHRGQMVDGRLFAPSRVSRRRRDHHRIRLEWTGRVGWFLPRIDVEHAGRAGMITIVALLDGHTSTTASMFWRRVDEHPLDVLALRCGDDPLTELTRY